MSRAPRKMEEPVWIITGIPSSCALAYSGRGFWYDRAYFLAKLHANVYMEIAGLPPQKLLDYFPELERVAQGDLWL